MNKKKMKKIVSLHADGVSDQQCLAILLEMCRWSEKTYFEQAQWILDYFEYTGRDLSKQFIIKPPNEKT